MADALYYLNDTAPVSLGVEFEPIATPWAEIYWGMPGFVFEAPQIERFAVHAVTLPMVPWNRPL